MRKLLSEVLPAFLAVAVSTSGCENAGYEISGGKDPGQDVPVFDEPCLISSSLLFVTPGAALYDMISEQFHALPGLEHEIERIVGRSHNFKVSVSAGHIWGKDVRTIPLW